MNICKEAVVWGAGLPTPEQMEKINRLTKTPLTAEQVYVFSLRLCDDQPDRDFERFDTDALPALAALFVGKTGIGDHNWSTKEQSARIFETQVRREGQTSYIKAWAYTLRNAAHQPLIEDIEAGIKKEVSVGCSMERRVCSICGAAYGTCRHQKGQEYDGTLCVAVLQKPLDAYEFSFVAVPAQPKAGVMKAWKGGAAMTLKELVADGSDSIQAEYAAICKQAALGKVYEDKLRQEILRQSLLLELDLAEPVLCGIMEKLDYEELLALSDSLTAKTRAMLPLTTQLPQAGSASTPFESEYLI